MKRGRTAPPLWIRWRDTVDPPLSCDECSAAATWLDLGTSRARCETHFDQVSE